MKLGEFSSFGQFLTESDDAERVLKVDATVKRSGSFVGVCDSKKTMQNRTFFMSGGC